MRNGILEIKDMRHLNPENCCCSKLSLTVNHNNQKLYMQQSRSACANFYRNNLYLQML